jgi:hypothetical protein
MACVGIVIHGIEMPLANTLALREPQGEGVGNLAAPHPAILAAPHPAVLDPSSCGSRSLSF